LDPEAANVLHTTSRGASWSRANERGAYPGVSTPLNWSIWGALGERAVRRAVFELGLLEASALDLPSDTDSWMWSIFYGRPTANVDLWRAVHVGLSGEPAAAEATERRVFGVARVGATGPGPQPAAPADVAAKSARAAADAPARMRALRAEVHRSWAETTNPARLVDSDWCRSRFAAAFEQLARADHLHIIVSMLAANAIGKVSSLAVRSGHAEGSNALLTGYPGMEEFRTAAALWEVSRGRRSLDEFLAEHGFHGPYEGEVSSRSWREAPGPAVAVVRACAGLAESEAPECREQASVRAREAFESRLRDALPAAERDAASRAFEQAATFIPLRETGKANLIALLDALRACARGIGRELAAQGRLADAEDVFFLTRDEIFDPPAAARALAVERRALRAHYQSFEIPETWQGMPEKLPAPSAAEPTPAGAVLGGIGASDGVHEGRARVVLDPAGLEAELEPGDVLVVEATDPSWAPLFLVAGAVVMDSGSLISHAALVAREMGIPAVVATRDGTRRLGNGQRVRVDGGAGTVTVLA
jgi:phosphohistidine swiveling domain-containing protein